MNGSGTITTNINQQPRSTSLPTIQGRIQKISEGVAVCREGGDYDQKTVFKAYSRRKKSSLFVSTEKKLKKNLNEGVAVAGSPTAGSATATINQQPEVVIISQLIYREPDPALLTTAINEQPLIVTLSPSVIPVCSLVRSDSSDNGKVRYIFSIN
jgi:hypothetical protein